MGYITKSQLSSFATAKVGLFANRAELLSEARKYDRASYTSSIFLSHSHHDASQVENAVIFLRKMGVDVYVDWMDDLMPTQTSGETAKILKDKIRENDKFIFLATNNSINSKWCNWEIGYADAFKYPNNKIALFPLVDDNGSWQGSEYLQIYPYIIKDSDYITDCYKVVFPDGSKKSLSDWLQSDMVITS
jgi:hypothetical protein